MQFLKKNLTLGTHVKIVKTGSPVDGMIAEISQQNWFDTYILYFGKTIKIDSESPAFKAITLPEMNLEEII